MPTLGSERITLMRPVRLLARLKADVCPEAPTQPVTRPSRSVATMLINNYMGGSSPHWRTAPLRRTDNQRIKTVCHSKRVPRQVICRNAVRRLWQPKTASRCICANGAVRDAVDVANPVCKKVRICGLFRGFCRLSLHSARNHDPVSRADCEDAHRRVEEGR